MKPDKHDKLETLFMAARSLEPDFSALETGFETRALARIRAERERRAPLFVWAWKLVPVFTALVIALGAWYAVIPERPADIQTAIAAEYDQALSFSHLIGDQI